MLTVIVIGGSVSNGVGGAGEGWFDLLKRNIEYASPNDAIVYGLGIYGNTSTQVAERFVREVEPRLRPKGRNIVILQVGGNDTAQRRNEGQLGDYLVSPERFEQNLRQILNEIQDMEAKEAARELEIELIIQLILPVNQKATAGSDPEDRVPAVTPRRVKTNAAAALFNGRIHAVFDELVATGSASYLDAPRALGQDYVQYLSADGVHPNPAGHDKIYGFLVMVLEEMGIAIG